MTAISLVPADAGGCGHYRIIQPGEQYARTRNKVVSLITPGKKLPTAHEWSVADKAYGFDFVLMHRSMDDHHRNYWLWFKRVYPHIKLYMDWDDLLWNPHSSSSYKPSPANIRNLDIVAGLADRLICSTKPMQDALWHRYKKKARIIPNMIAEREFRTISRREEGDKLRVVWAGSATHQVDLEQIIPVVKATHERFDWHFMGYVPPEVKDVVTFNAGAPMGEYLSALDSIKAHVGIAPLSPIAFNKCKSNLKLLEYGALGIATVASQFYPYAKSSAHMIPTGHASEWIKALDLLDNEDTRLKNAEASQQYSRSFILENGSGVIQNAYE